MSYTDAVDVAEKTLDSVWDDRVFVNPVVLSKAITLPENKTPMEALQSLKKRQRSRISRLVSRFGEKEYPVQFSPGEDEYLVRVCFSRVGHVFHCFYNDSVTDEKKRFAQAHALGHIMLGHVRPFSDTVMVDSGFPKNPNFKEDFDANIFASEILMPREHLRIAVQRWQNISTLAALFGVATNAMLYRLKILGYLPEDDE